MNYALAILAHRECRTYRRAVESFADNVTPQPTTVQVFADAVNRDVLDHVVAVGQHHFGDRLRVASTHVDRQQGFCGATRRLWDLCVAADERWVFWLEADFVFLRQVNLNHLATVMRSEPLLAQMALIRDACNEQEVRAGGLVASRPGEFEPRETDGYRWMSQASYWTTNPSLMQYGFMWSHRFLDDGGPYCEGRFGAALKALGYRFGAWGHGEEWVAHMGIRDGTGKGY